MATPPTYMASRAPAGVEPTDNGPRAEVEMREFEEYDKWSVDELCAYLRKSGLHSSDVMNAFKQHRITGNLAPLLTTDDLKEMGIRILGERLICQKAIRELTRAARVINRTKIVWESTEELYYSKCTECFETCCGLCPDDPAKYKLTSSSLRITRFYPWRFFCIRLTCCGGNYKRNNIDLTKIDDIDVEGATPPLIMKFCCCAHGFDTLLITTSIGHAGVVRNNNNQETMTLKGGTGFEAASVIMSQVEEAQMNFGAGTAHHNKQ